MKTLWFKAAILGFVGYVLFNFTNYFLIKNYDLKVAFVDTAYGTIAFPVIITIYLYLKKYLKMWKTKNWILRYFYLKTYHKNIIYEI